MFLKSDLKKKILFSLISLWFILFTLIPFIFLFLCSFKSDSNFTLSTYIEFLTIDYIKLTIETVIYASIITVISIFFALNGAYYISKLKARNIIISLILIPCYMNLLLKVYSFISILGDQGLINNILMNFQIHIQFLFTLKGFLIVTTYIFFPIALLPIYYSIIKVNNNTLNAAYDLGASDSQVLYKVVVPKIKATIYNAIQLVFIPSLSLFMITRIIAGNKIMTLGTLIEQEFIVTNNWQMGATVSIILILIAIICMYLIKKTFKVGN